MFGSLRLRATISPGETLVLGGDIQPAGLGRQFFFESTASGERHHLLLIRVAQTQLDDLFAPETENGPIVSAGD